MPNTSKPFGRGVILSILIHVLVIFFLIWRPSVLLEESKTPGGAGPRGGGGGGGAEQVSYIRLDFPQSSQAAVSVPVPAVTMPTIKMPDIKLEDPKINMPQVRIEVAGQIRGTGAGTGGDKGAGTGTGGGVGGGVGTGVGNDRGPGTGGNGGDVFPPKPHHVVWPFDDNKPRSVAGRRFTVFFSVDETGKVTDIEIRPEIGDGSYRQRFMSQLREWTFDPGFTRDGKPVKAVFPVTVTL